VTNATVPVILL